ncbi:MAG: 6-phospho-3-hexuloisomerase [Patescibacteria group bacterium]|nr:6-phospho-3-hexuloisomerase [Patescibacteria group bacterium]
MQYERIIDEIRTILLKIDFGQVEDFIEHLVKSHRVYVIGEGRSGLVARGFAMRLIHLRKKCYVVGESITPALRRKDMLLAISGSGETRSVVETAETAKRLGADVMGITAKTQSNLTRFCDHYVVIPSKIMKKSLQSFEIRELEGVPLEPPLGSLFEVSTMIFFEVIVMELMQRLKISEKQMYKVHQNL